MAEKPNILFIFTDQQSATMMSCAGNAYVNTTAMDSIAASGVRFDRAYCTNPVCVPSRFSLMTGRMPSAIGLASNDCSHIDSIPRHILDFGVGWLLRSAGYEVAYAGKVHLPKIIPQDIGFDHICTDERDKLAQQCADFIGEKRRQPFFLVASFINPHDICYMSIRDSRRDERERGLVKAGVTECQTLDRALMRPPGVDEETFFSTHCPPLPENFEPQKDEPEGVRQALEQWPFRTMARQEWDERRWREHRWAYARLTEMVDSQIGRVLEALRKNRLDESTIVIFSSDHGDMDSAHRMDHKITLYEEACRVPLVISQPGGTRGVNRNLVSNGLDLLPTLCDFAGVCPPSDLMGHSLRPIMDGKRPAMWREWLPVENEFGRMIVTDEHKYMLHDKGRNREQLVDLGKDPGETRNVADEPEYRETIRKCRHLFAQHFGSEQAAEGDAANRAP